MEQFDLVKHFSEDVDNILAGDPQVSRPELQSEYNDLLNLAAVLASADLAPESQKQQILRRQLINRCLAKNTAEDNKEVIMKNFLRKHRPAMLTCSFAMVAMLGFYLIFPGVLTAMANSIGNILKLGPYVTLIADDAAPEPAPATPLTAEQQAQLDKNGYVEYTDKNGNLVLISTWGEPPVDKVNYSKLADAQKGVSYKLLVPTYLPQGYSFKNAECYKGSQKYITLNFQGPGQDITLMQRLMNEQTKYEAAGEKVEPVTINGNNGAWVDSSLTWGIDDVNYILIAKGQSKDEIMKIAESVK
jgi:hypothetical protein